MLLGNTGNPDHGHRRHPTYASWAVFEVAKGKLAMPPIPAQEARVERDDAAYWASRDVVTIRNLTLLGSSVSPT